MKNVTVTMDEKLLRKARIAAAHEGKSLSRFIAEVVEQHVGRPLTQNEAFERFLAGPDWSSGAAPLPRREELYEERVHRHERSDLREKSRFSDESSAGSYMAERSDAGERGGD